MGCGCNKNKTSKSTSNKPIVVKTNAPTSNTKKTAEQLRLELIERLRKKNG